MRSLTIAVLFFGYALGLNAQGNYEVQVYASELTPKGATMVELHSNFTPSGSTKTDDGTLGTNHQVHETLEITRGINEWFETGFYQFTCIQPDGSWQWVGTHIRPRVAVPEKYGLPVGLSLSMEFGYQRPRFSADTWTWEIRPIIDKKIGKFYWSFNPTFDKSFRGPSQNTGYVFSPNAKFSYDVTKKVAAGMEYYGSVGSLTGLDAIRDQEHLLVPAVDIDFGKNWEFNFGVGVGVTQATDHLLVKAILGYRFHNHQD
jgi:hypothetical protein